MQKKKKKKKKKKKIRGLGKKWSLDLLTITDSPFKLEIAKFPGEKQTAF